MWSQKAKVDIFYFIILHGSKLRQAGSFLTLQRKRKIFANNPNQVKPQTQTHSQSTPQLITTMTLHRPSHQPTSLVGSTAKLSHYPRWTDLLRLNIPISIKILYTNM